MTFTATSLIDPHQTVRIDPWGANPMLEDAMQSAPATVALARAQNGEPPTMFASGDAPPFLASGVDPRFLAVLPWRTRHAAATVADAGTVLGYVEQYANQPDAEIPSTGLGDYIARFRDWLGGRWTNPHFAKPDQGSVDAANDDLYAGLFGASDAAQAAKIATINAANPPRPRTAAELAAQQIGRAQR